jgi:hypothetical protein
LILGQGEQRILRVSGLHRYSIGSGAVRAISLSKPGDQILLKGILPGSADLWVWKKDGGAEHRTIRVEKLSGKEKNLPLERALSLLDEAEVIYSGKGIILRGTIRSLVETSKIAGVLRNFPKEIHDETELAEDLLAESERSLNQWLKKTEFSKNLRIERVGQSLWMRGALEKPSEKSTAQKQAAALFPPLQFEIESLPDHAPTVYFRVFLLELKKNEFQSLGISWPGSTQNAFQVTSGAVQNLLQIDLTLQHLESRGSAKILSNPELVVRAPGEAELFAGGELPIQNQNRYHSNVTWKNYGLTLRLKVTHVTGSRVRLDIFTEVSHLDPNGSPDKIPGIQANRMKTQVDARFGTPLLLSGLLQQGIREEARGIPFLRGIPILGLLFGSQDYLNEKSELVAILFPHANPPTAPIERLQAWTPKGPLPPPRNWIRPDEERELKMSEDYPWNAFE